MVKWTRETSMDRLAMGLCSCWIYLVHWNLGGSDGESFVLRPTSRGLNDPAGTRMPNEHPPPKKKKFILFILIIGPDINALRLINGN